MIPVLKKNNALSKSDLQDGFILLIDKEVDWTSFDVVKKVRNLVQVKKVGHAGTLDPFATGLLILGIGKGTRELGRLSGLSKRYAATILLGKRTDSFDRTGKILEEKDTSGLMRDQIEQAIVEMSGTMEQVPPMYSAKKVKGVPLYHYARKNKEVHREAVSVTIYEAQITNWENPFLSMNLLVSKGTYIRAYAEDLGKKLGTGALLHALRRTEIDRFKTEESFTISEFAEYWKQEIES